MYISGFSTALDGCTFLLKENKDSIKKGQGKLVAKKLKMRNGRNGPHIAKHATSNKKIFEELVKA